MKISKKCCKGIHQLDGITGEGIRAFLFDSDSTHDSIAYDLEKKITSSKSEDLKDEGSSHTSQERRFCTHYSARSVSGFKEGGILSSGL